MVICVKVFGVFLMFIKLSSYSNLITHTFVISLRSPFHYAVHKSTNRSCFLSNQVLCLFKFYPLGKWKILSNRIVFADTQLQL